MLLPLAGRRLYYDLAGPESGPVVCFAHALASDSGMWAEQLPPLFAAGFRALRLEMRGHGGSDPVPGDATMDELADDAAAVVEALGLARVHFVGLSIGGMFGQAFALRHGTKLASLVLCDTIAASLPNAKEVWGPRVETVARANSLAPIAEDTMTRWLSDTYRQRNPGRWRQLHDTVAATTPQGYIGCVAAIMKFDWRAQLPTLKVPTLCLCGAHDPSGGPLGARRIASLIPGARYDEIAATHHLPNVERPDIFNRLLMDWLDAHR